TATTCWWPGSTIPPTMAWVSVATSSEGSRQPTRSKQTRKRRTRSSVARNFRRGDPKAEHGPRPLLSAPLPGLRRADRGARALPQLRAVAVSPRSGLPGVRPPEPGRDPVRALPTFAAALAHGARRLALRRRARRRDPAVQVGRARARRASRAGAAARPADG